jgi:inositol-phosphate phosphatase / L-galactose 1-phosphate phosphatase / histidinol-phosphatase
MAAACPPDLIALAHRLADASGPVIRRHFRTPFDIVEKADQTPVTIADREAEEALRALIKSARPDHGIIGEEFGNERTDARHVWVLDPIDGTGSFASGKPVFGTLIALLEDGVPILGVIDQPITGERWIGARGHATTLNNKPVRTRACPGLKMAWLDSTSPDLFSKQDGAAFQRLAEATLRTRWGTDCYAYAVLATGFVDLVCETGLKLYDFAALIPVVEGAGGVITDWSGKPLDRHSKGHVLAAGNARVHAEACRVLAGH